MKRLYFTYGTSETQPYQGGWTMVEAPSVPECLELYKAIHPPVNDCVPCAFIYTEPEFMETTMYEENNNLGHGCWETIRFEKHKSL